MCVSLFLSFYIYPTSKRTCYTGILENTKKSCDMMPSLGRVKADSLYPKNTQDNIHPAVSKKGY